MSSVPAGISPAVSNSSSTFIVRKVAVLGAGVMGAQIAAHLTNANVEALLFELPAKEGDPNGNVIKAIDNLKKIKPSPLGSAKEAVRIQAANYEEHLGLLGECDLVIEAIAERMDWKRDLYEKIAAHVAPHAILASNTSGLSITALSEQTQQIGDIISTVKEVAEQSNLLALNASIEAAKAGDADGARREFEAADQTVHARIRTDYAAAQTAYQLMKLYQDTAIPQAKRSGVFTRAWSTAYPP